MIYAAEQKRTEVIKQRKEWEEFIQSADPEKLVFLDESGINTDFTRNYGRSIGKSRVIDHVPRNTPKTTTVVSSIRLNGEHAHQTVEGAMNTEKFKTYIKDVLCPTLKPGDIVIMDNLSIHKNKSIEELIKAVGATVKFLPPYSPDFNPIEMLWSKMKAFLRKWKIRIREFLPAAVDKALSYVSSLDCRDWFTACQCCQHF